MVTIEYIISFFFRLKRFTFQSFFFASMRFVLFMRSKHLTAEFVRIRPIYHKQVKWIMMSVRYVQAGSIIMGSATHDLGASSDRLICLLACTCTHDASNDSQSWCDAASCMLYLSPIGQYKDEYLLHQIYKLVASKSNCGMLMPSSNDRPLFDSMRQEPVQAFRELIS